MLAQNATYHKFFRGWVFARSLRIGTESPYGRTWASFRCRSAILWAARTRIAALRSTRRGRAIRARAAPVGGNAMVVNNLELRSPPAPLPWVGNNLSFVLFHDMGNAVRYGQRDVEEPGADEPARSGELPRRRVRRRSCDFSYMSSALGTGVRYRTPIGPVRLDLGYNLNPPWFSVDTPCAGVTTTPCDPTPYVEQVRHFNFFFSIGQTF